MPFRNAFLVFLLLAACTTNAAAKTFAYFQFDNTWRSTKLLQYEVDEKGKFKPLNPEIVKLDNHYHEPMIVHPSGRFAYFNNSIQANILLYTA